MLETAVALESPDVIGGGSSNFHYMRIGQNVAKGTLHSQGFHSEEECTVRAGQLEKSHT